MKRALILLLTASSLFAQGPTYNFSFYNNGSTAPVVKTPLNESPAPVAPVIQPIPQVQTAPPVVRESKKRFGFEFSGGISTPNFDEQVVFMMEENTSMGYFNFLIPVGDKSIFKLGVTSANSFGLTLLGASVGFQGKANIFSFLSMTGGIQLDYLTKDSNKRIYAGVYAGPQVEIGDMFVNAVAQAGYGHTKFDDLYFDAGHFEVGGRVSIGFMF